MAPAIAGSTSLSPSTPSTARFVLQFSTAAEASIAISSITSSTRFFTTKTGGLGLGLAVCRSIIVAHEGRLWASNNSDRGAAFHFTIPAR
jgi:Histidine kinase-, DNA gyrase B-, and HSP90-like ATPase